MLAAETPSSFVAFDCLAIGLERPARRAAGRPARGPGGRAGGSAGIGPADAGHIDPKVARHWFDIFEGAGLDGVIAKRHDLRYLPGKREMAKIKHLRTADCVVAGFRWHKNGPGTMVGSLLLGLWNDAGQLQHVGVTSSFTVAKRKELVGVPGAVPRRTR